MKISCYTEHWCTCSASRISTQKEPFPRSEFTLALNVDILDARRSPNAVRVHAGTTQVDFKVDRPPPADSPPGDLLITMVKETAKKKVSKKWKKKWNLFVSISHWSDSDENAIHCEIARDCVKRANVGLGRKKFRQEAHSYPQANICSASYGDHNDKHTWQRRWWRWSPTGLLWQT